MIIAVDSRRACRAGPGVAFRGRALGRARADRCRHAELRHRHAWRAGACPPISHTCPMSTRTRPRAAASPWPIAGAFDSLNPYNVRALSTAQGLSGNVYQTLMMRSADEPFTLYGLIAQSIETDAARDSCRLSSRSARAIFRRRADHLAGRRLHLQPAEGKGPAAAARRAQPRQKHRDAGRR